MNIDWNFVLSLVTAGTAVYAIIQTRKQIKISNKQYLFERRFSTYLLVKELIQLYNENFHLLKEEGPYMVNNFNFHLLTNCPYLEKIQDAIYTPLEQPIHKEFLIKLADLKKLSEEVKFIFNGDGACLLSDFVFDYQDLLFKMYQYQIMLSHIDKANKENPRTFEELSKLIGEEEPRKCLQDAIKKLQLSMNKLTQNKIQQTIEKQIKLIG